MITGEKWIPLCEDEPLVCEMANKWKEETQLPVNIWIDEAEHYIADCQSKRIRFQLDKADKFNRNCADMDFQGNIYPQEIEHNIRKMTELSTRDVRAVKYFVKNNKYALEKLADQEIKMFQIWDYIIKGGEIASEEQIGALNAKVNEIISEKQKVSKK